MVEIDYDAKAQAAYVRFTDEPIAETLELALDVYADVTADHVLIGVEMLGVKDAGSVVGKLAVSRLTERADVFQLSDITRTFLLALSQPQAASAKHFGSTARTDFAFAA